MIYSMTGYGKCSKEVNGKKITIEVRTLNSKGLDVNLKIPGMYREKENELRNLISSKLDRGKIDFWLNQEDLGESSNVRIDAGLVKSYYQQLKKIGADLQTDTDWMQIIFRMQDVVKPAEGDLTDKEWHALEQVASEALDQCMNFRRSEGEQLQMALVEHIKRIEELMAGVTPFESARVTRLRERILKNLEDSIKDGKIDKDRFEQEIIFYLEKLDITEEKIRLKSHLDYFIETMQGAGFNGRKLNFIGQEMGREINTLGSKANDSDIQKLVVLMKDELEKIKEQVLNVL
jgi:uncharacterized protein (TIGR00255 family)